MSLSSSIGTALSGLNAAQAGLDLVSRNIANANTPGYTKKIQQTTNLIAGNEGIGVFQRPEIRSVDKYLLTQLRGASASTARLSVQDSFLRQIDQMFGSPSSNSSIAASVTDMQNKLQAVATTPDDDAARQTFLNAASNLAGQLNSMSDRIQGLRQQAEQGLSDSVSQANALLQSVAQLNIQIAQARAGMGSSADLEDKRDMAINQLASLMDVKTIDRDDGTIAVFTSGGQLLVDKEAAALSFDARTSLDATSAYNMDPAKRTVGTITMTMGTTNVDLIASNAIRSGTIAGYIEMRDDVLVEAQAQLDELASQMALALSSDTIGGTAATGTGTSEGFALDLSAFLAGNATGSTGKQINLTYTDGTGTHNVTIVPVADASLLPLSNTVTNRPDDRVIGIHVDPLASAADQMTAVLAALGTALPSTLVASNPSGNVLRILDDGTSSASIGSMSATVVQNAGTLRDGSGTGLSLFVDGTDQSTYTGAIGNPSEKTGFAGRIAVSQALLSDNTGLVIYETGKLIGDDTRPNDLLARLANPDIQYSGATGIGSAGTPYAGSIDAFARRIVSFQSAQAASAATDHASQKIVSNSLQARFDSETGVSIDEEMSNLITLQSAYAANARVIATIRELFDTLLTIGR